jgi:beta-lactamase regulating signal transducer with metallopeptidase domain
VLLESSPLLNLAAWIATASLKGTVLIVAVTIFRRLLASGATSMWRHALWLPVLACLICPLGPGVPLTTALPSSLPAPLVALPTELNAEATPAAMDGVLGSRSHRQTPLTRAQRASPATIAPKAAASADKTRSEAVLFWIILAWAAGASAFALLYLSNLLKFRRLGLAACAPGATARGVFERCKAELRVRQTVRLLETGAIDSPIVVGWWRPAILLPLGLDVRLDTARLRHVLLHELAHVRRNDVLVNWIAAIAQLLHWFNPAVWLAGRLMRADMESASDAFVLGHLSRAERTEYGDTLVHLADANGGMIPPRYGLGIADRHRDLKGRLIMIARFGSASIAVRLGAGIALVAFTGAALVQPSLSSPFGAAERAQGVYAAGLADHQQLLQEQTRPQKEVPFSQANFDKYAGYYRFADVSMFARVYRSTDRYYVEVTGKGPVEVFPESPTEFFATAVPAQVSFAADRDGQVTEMTLHQAGFLQTASRVSKAAYEAAAAKLQQRIAANEPSPGTQASLLLQLKGWEKGEPDYADMGAGLASASREQHEQMWTMIRYLGALKGLKFVTVNPNGWDVYLATFSEGTVKCLIAPLSSEGKVTGLFYLP